MLFRSCVFPFSLVFPLQFCFGPCLNLTRNMVYDRKTVMEAFVSALLFLNFMCVSIAVFLRVLFESQPQHVIEGKTIRGACCTVVFVCVLFVEPFEMCGILLWTMYKHQEHFTQHKQKQNY